MKVQHFLCKGRDLTHFQLAYVVVVVVVVVVFIDGSNPIRVMPQLSSRISKPIRF